ncbi:MAG TPA: hypothetical protein VN947_13320 [Polyangia bacterium]|nr:hypothetical protein [Polyangia bacterium]
MDANAPYLPPVEPTDNAPAAKKKSARKTLLLWVLLLFMFVAIYQLFSGPPPSHHHHDYNPCPDASGGVGFGFLNTFVPMFAVVFLMFWFLRRQFRGGTSLNAKLEPGLLALADGDLGRASDIFGAVAREYRKQTAYAAVAKLSLATALMRSGELQPAIEAAIEVERAPGLLFGSDARTMAATHLGLVYALRGQLDAATRWCDDARKRLSRGSNRTHSAALLRLAEATVLTRSGQLDDATRALDRDWKRLEEALAVSTMRRAWLLRAYLASGDGARGSVEPWLTLARGGRKGELAWLGAEWPELRAFLDAHDL